MDFRRGFKTEANKLVLEVRRELGLSQFSSLDPRILAAHLSIEIISLSSFVADFPQVKYLITEEPEVFSAVTVVSGLARTIVHNDSHALVRQNSNLAHELAHALLQHPPSPAFDFRGCRKWNEVLESEASWLGAALLVPEQATLAIANGRWTKETAANHFQVSESIIQFRMNSTGALARAARFRKTKY